MTTPKDTLSLPVVETVPAARLIAALEMAARELRAVLPLAEAAPHQYDPAHINHVLQQIAAVLRGAEGRKAAGDKKTPRQQTALTSHELEQVKEAQACVGEANQRARARGLTAEALEREWEDDDSQYWDDYRDVLREYRRRHGSR
jgi:hypothetical protein